jgi:hypothetical protein
MELQVLDWGGWFLSNVLVGIFFPLFAMALMHLLKKILKSQQAISYTAPFRDGQLGFVSVGWVVASLVEIVKYQVNHTSVSMTFYVVVLVASAGLSALIAAAGAVAPAEVPPQPPATKADWIFNTYPAFSASVLLCVIILPLTALVHGVTS